MTRHSASHWTKTLRAEQTTTKLGSRFHLRKLFLRHVELTESELEFVIKYLIHETTVQEQMWWRALTAYERLELVGQFTLHHVPRGEEHNLWFASIETTKDCILLYGKAEAKPIDRESTPVVNFLEGSVFGNLTLPYRLRTQLKKFQSTQPIEATHAPTSAAVFRRLKRETAFRDSIEKYSRVVVYGPADYFILTSTAVAGTTLKAVERVEQDNWLKSYGLDRFAGCIRRATFEPGAVLVREGEMASAVLIVIQGECRASVEIANRTTRPKSSDESSKSHRKEPTLAQEVLMHQHRFEVESTQLAIATLGANSVIGDVSIMLNIPEPTTVQAITPVVALSLSHEYLLHELEVKDQPTSASFEQLKLVAFDTLKFTLDRIQVEAEVEQCDQTLKILDLERVIAANEEAMESARLSMRRKRKLALQAIHRGNPILPADDKDEERSVSEFDSMSMMASRSLQDLKRGARTGITRRKSATTLLDSPRLLTELTFSSIRSPLTRPLGEHSNAQQLCEQIEREEQLDSRRPNGHPDSDLLFLYPTLTRQRQLHAKPLPMLPKLRGII